MAIPQTYGRSERILANYDFYDVAAGTGYITFYLGNSYITSYAYHLTNLTYYSYNKESTVIDGYVTSSEYTESYINFDIQLNRPLTIRGKAILNFSVYMYYSISGGSRTLKWYEKQSICKYDGVTTTEIASVTYNENSYSGAGSSESYQIRTATFTIPKTHFKKGEYLRLRISVWAQSGGSDGWPTLKYRVATDPKNRSYNSHEFTAATLLIPVMINV